MQKITHTPQNSEYRREPWEQYAAGWVSIGIHRHCNQQNQKAGSHGFQHLRRPIPGSVYRTHFSGTETPWRCDTAHQQR